MAYQHDIYSGVIVNRWHGSIMVVVMSNSSGVHPLSQAVRWSRAQRMRIEIQKPKAIKKYKNTQRKWIDWTKTWEIQQLRPFQEAVLTSMCLSAGCRRPESQAALPQECCRKTPTHGSPPLQKETQPQILHETGTVLSHRAARWTS